MAVLVPITNQAKGYPFEVPLPSRLKTTGVILADAVRSLDWRERHARYSDTAPTEVIKAVQIRLMELLGFSKDLGFIIVDPESNLRPRHLLRPHQLIKFLASKVAQLQRRFPQAAVVDMRGVGDLRGFVVAHLRRQCRHQH